MIEQRSDEWFAQRLGKVTASRVADVMAKTRTGYGASRANYAAELVAERLTGAQTDFYVNDAMRRGTELEPLARDTYAFIKGVHVVETGFHPHPTLEWAGASPDGFVGDDGMVELKCCGTAKHIALLTSGEPDDRYVKQVVWQMACTGRQWCDIAYYDPRLPVEMQMHITRIGRDAGVIAEMEAEVSRFLAEVAETTEQLRATYMKEAA